MPHQHDWLNRREPREDRKHAHVGGAAREGRANRRRRKPARSLPRRRACTSGGTTAKTSETDYTRTARTLSSRCNCVPSRSRNSARTRLAATAPSPSHPERRSDLVAWPATSDPHHNRSLPAGGSVHSARETTRLLLTAATSS